MVWSYSKSQLPLAPYEPLHSNEPRTMLEPLWRMPIPSPPIVTLPLTVRVPVVTSKSVPGLVSGARCRRWRRGRVAEQRLGQAPSKDRCGQRRSPVTIPAALTRGDSITPNPVKTLAEYIRSDIYSYVEVAWIGRSYGCTEKCRARP